MGDVFPEPHEELLPNFGTNKYHVLAVLFVDVTAIGGNNGLQARPECLTPIDDGGARHGGPVLVNGVLEGVDIGVVDRAGFGLNLPPEREVKWVRVRGVRGQKSLGKKGMFSANHFWVVCAVCTGAPSC